MRLMSSRRLCMSKSKVTKRPTTQPAANPPKVYCEECGEEIMLPIPQAMFANQCSKGHQTEDSLSRQRRLHMEKYFYDPKT